MLVVSRRQVYELLSMRDCIEVMTRALAALARGESMMPLRTVLKLPSGRDFFAVMPAYVGSPAAMGAKVITVFPGNHGTALDSHQGAVLLLDAEKGSIVAVIDAASITAIRTAAVSAVATKFLARRNADDLAILGSGVQAKSHIEAISIVRPPKRIRVWSRHFDSAKKLAASMTAAVHIEAVESAEDAVRGASIVCTATSSGEAVLKGDWLSPGAHVNAVGASTPQARELDTQAIVRSSLFADRRESVLKEPGDFLIPLSEGAVTEKHIVAELGEVVAGMHPGRRRDDEITVFKSLGLAVEDVAAARYVYEQAIARSVGTVVDLDGA